MSDIGSVRGGSPFSQIAAQFGKIDDNKHIRSSEGKELYTSGKASLTGLKSLFGKTDSMKARTEKQEAGALKIRDALNQQYGKGFGDMVFIHVGKQMGRDFYSGVTGSDLRAIMEATKPMDELHAFQATKSELLAAMPPGMKINDHGVISGSYTGTNYGVDVAKLQEKSGRSFGDTMVDASVTELTPKTKMEKTDEGEVLKTLPQPEYSGVKISHQAEKDFYRMDLTVHQDDGTFRTREDHEKAETTRTNTVVTQLLNFTGDETAVGILSTVLNQNLSRPILDGLTDQYGNRAEYVIDQGKMGDAQFRRDDGQLEAVRGSGIGALKLDLSKDVDGNFEVTGSWQMLFSQLGRGFDKSPIPGMDGAVIKGDSQMKFTIDAEQAKAGKLVFVHPPVVNVDFSGKMA